MASPEVLQAALGSNLFPFAVESILSQVGTVRSGAAAYDEYSENKANSAELSWSFG